MKEFIFYDKNNFGTQLIEKKSDLKEVSDFLKREYERKYKGNPMYRSMSRIAPYSTHYFVCRNLSVGDMPIVAVLIMGQPNAFSKMMGSMNDSRDLNKCVERQITRLSFNKRINTESLESFIQQSINWMASNTQYKAFTMMLDDKLYEGYEKELLRNLGFHYVGQKFGTTRKYLNPFNGHFVTDRTFRSRSFYKRYAKELGIEWDRKWNKGDHINWENIPKSTLGKLKEYGKKLQSESSYVIIPKKHKFVKVWGRNLEEIYKFNRIFFKHNTVETYNSQILDNKLIWC